MASPLPTRRGAAAPSARSTLSSALSASLEHVCRPPQAGTRCASGIPEAPTMPTASSGNSVSGVGDVRRDGIQGAVYARSTTQTSSHRRPAQDLRADTEGSVSAAGTVALAAAASSFRDQAPRQPPEQQQSGTTSFTSLPPGSSPTSYHSDADVARVRAALAEAGYPSPSWDDIERVLAQLSATHNGGGGSAAARHGNAVPPPSATCLPQGIKPEDLGEEGQRVAYYHDSHGAAIPPPAASSPQQQRQKEDCSTGSSSLLHYLEPSLRLQRYIQLRERELEELCLRPSLGSLHTQQQQQQQQQRRRGSAAAGPQAQRTRGSGAAVGASPAALGGVQVSAMATHHRRAANIVFDATGDQRFRFFPTTRTPQGISTLATVAPVPRTSSSSTSTKVLMDAAPAHPAAPATRLGSYHNYCHCPRPNSCGTVGGQVSYLDPAGRTLRRKADPVKRGEQMRLLWAQDSFLSQRDRPREAWRTRQITMAYGQDTSSSGASIRHG